MIAAPGEQSTRPIGVILAGGRASRYGGAAKGLSVVGGRRIIDRIASALHPLCEKLVIVSGNAQASSWLPDTEVIIDDEPGAGPVPAIATALRKCGRDVLLVAWDMPLVTTAVLRPLLGAEIAAECSCWSTRRGPEPLCALYRTRALPGIEQASARGVRRAAAVVESLQSVVRPWSGVPEDPFFSVNTPADAALAESLLAASITPTSIESTPRLVTR